ncbi:MAG: hypothetical protein A2589_03655 [Candidatus Vogelbacteria bacterium RIFOXYD1_FULL_46_19]|uniref:TIGR00341 family protein n=1 Tax=Candidatus Vogelbacteria bacterium RIFOXYD1_FULL_46_19 TaxID=1802439 RepID=A0A1G2QIS8_9BACT|nr:MAG: hypothetical protein A2589_03655 [Candidatus Vogelbacteria bacterium RIFOXYD1_FULL_46_19]
MGKMFQSVFVANFLDQTKTLRELLEESRERTDFYILLTLATFIATLGLLINDSIVILGGMLIAPILFPILGISMGIVTASPLALGRSLKVLVRSMGLVLLVSFSTTFLLGDNVVAEPAYQVAPDLMLFLIALASGVAVSYSWVKQNLSASLPGVAVAVALLTPLATVGVGLALWERAVIASSVSLFLVNLIATVLGSIVIFSLFGFATLQKEEEQKIVEEVLENKIQKEAVAEAAELLIKNSPAVALTGLNDKS